MLSRITRNRTICVINRDSVRFFVCLHVFPPNFHLLRHFLEVQVQSFVGPRNKNDYPRHDLSMSGGGFHTAFDSRFPIHRRFYNERTLGT